MDKITNAAIIILGIGEKYAAEILKNMTPKEVKAIMDAINKIDSISEEDTIRALNEFFVDSQSYSSIDMSLKDQVKDSILTMIGNNNINTALDGDLNDNSKWIEAIKMQPPHAILDLIIDEHPQIITMILIVIFSRVSSQKGSAIIMGLPKEVQNDVFKRMTAMGSISHYAINVISNYFNEELMNSTELNLIKVDGIETVANLLSIVDTQAESDILSALDSDDDIKGRIEEKVFPFHRLVDIDKKSLQTLLAEVKTEDLTLALKGVDDSIKNKFLSSMSSKSAEILKDELESLGPTKLTRVLDAQKIIVSLAKKLCAEEKILLTKKNDPNIIY